jgi:hypothetical protein
VLDLHKKLKNPDYELTTVDCAYAGFRHPRERNFSDKDGLFLGTNII